MRTRSFRLTGSFLATDIRARSVVCHRRQKEKSNKQTEWDWKGTGSDMSNAKYCIIAALLAVLAAASTALAQTTNSYSITQDTYIDSRSATLNYGTSGSDKVVDSTTPCNTLFQLPANLFSYSPGTIQSAIVSFYAFGPALQPGANTVYLYPLTQGFVPGTGSKNGTPGAGATWNTYDGTTPWTTPGGDYDAEDPVADITAASIVYNGSVVQVQPGDAPNGATFFTFDITSLLSNPTTDTELQDNGAILIIGSGASPQSYVTFVSADTTAANNTPAYRPLLDVTVVPEPSSLILVLVGLAGLTCFRKKRHARC